MCSVSIAVGTCNIFLFTYQFRFLLAIDLLAILERSLNHVASFYLLCTAVKEAPMPFNQIFRGEMYKDITQS